MKPIKNLPVGVNPFCKCGCGKLTAWNRRKNKWNVYVDGHYRKDYPYKNKEWLKREYDSGRTMEEIGKQFGVIGGTIKKFAKKFNLVLRSHSQTLKMRGSTKGNRNPSWKGGVTPERQKVQKTDEWRDLVKRIYKRDNYKCQRCGVGHISGNKLHAHHIKPWSKYPEFRLLDSNLITLCNSCHSWVHSNKNVNKEFLSTPEGD